MVYPIMLDIQDSNCLVVGGGTVAARKTRELVECGARVCVVSPELCGELQEKLKDGSIEWVRDCYKEQYLDGILLCFACTDDIEVNRKIAEDAKERNVLVNVADAGNKETLSNFITPSVRRKGDITLAVSCDENPAASRYTAGFLKDCIEDWQADYMRAAKGLRLECRRRVADPETRQAFMKGLFQPDMLELAMQNIEEARKKAAERLDELCQRRNSNE